MTGRVAAAKHPPLSLSTVLRVVVLKENLGEGVWENKLGGKNVPLWGGHAGITVQVLLLCLARSLWTRGSIGAAPGCHSLLPALVNQQLLVSVVHVGSYFPTIQFNYVPPKLVMASLLRKGSYAVRALFIFAMKPRLVLLQMTPRTCVLLIYDGKDEL